MKKNSDNFSAKEAQRRFMASLKAAVNTPPKPKKAANKRTGKKRA
jgi:hypothetical protein